MGRLSKLQLLRSTSRERARDFITNRKLISNVFCPTGSGGGVNPTCSPNGKPSSLSSAATKAIEHWWTGGYEEINGALRNGGTHKSVAGLLEAIDKAEPTTEEKILYRGMSLNPNSMAAQNMKKGYSVFDDGFMAITDRKDVSDNFAIGGDLDNNAYVVTLKIPAGTKMADIPSGIGEKLLPPGNRFIVDKVTKKGNVRHVEARYINR